MQTDGAEGLFIKNRNTGDILADFFFSNERIDILENLEMSEQTGQELLDVCEILSIWDYFSANPNSGLELLTHEGTQEMYHQVHFCIKRISMLFSTIGH